MSNEERENETLLERLLREETLAERLQRELRRERQQRSGEHLIELPRATPTPAVPQTPERRQASRSL